MTAALMETQIESTKSGSALRKVDYHNFVITSDTSGSNQTRTRFRRVLTTVFQRAMRGRVEIARNRWNCESSSSSDKNQMDFRLRAWREKQIAFNSSTRASKLDADTIVSGPRARSINTSASENDDKNASSLRGFGTTVNYLVKRVGLIPLGKKGKKKEKERGKKAVISAVIIDKSIAISK